MVMTMIRNLMVFAVLALMLMSVSFAAPPVWLGTATGTLKFFTVAQNASNLSDATFGFTTNYKNQSTAEATVLSDGFVTATKTLTANMYYVFPNGSGSEPPLTVALTANEGKWIRDEGNLVPLNSEPNSSAYRIKVLSIGGVAVGDLVPKTTITPPPPLGIPRTVQVTLGSGNTTIQSLSTLTTLPQNGSNTFVVFKSSSTSDKQNITIKYLTSSYQMKQATYTLYGTTNVTTEPQSVYFLMDDMAMNDTDAENYTMSSLNATISFAGGSNDVAYIYGVSVSSAAAGDITVKDATGRTIYTISTGNLTPTDNGGSYYCMNTNGCTVRNMYFGGDGNFKLTANVTSTAGVERTKLVYWIPSYYTYTYGNILKYGFGERVTFYGTPQVNDTDVSIYYEGE